MRAGVKRELPSDLESVISYSGSDVSRVGQSNKARRRLAQKEKSFELEPVSDAFVEGPVSTEVFTSHILPLLWPKDDAAMYQVSDSESTMLRRSYAKNAALAAVGMNVSNLHHNLTYGEVLPQWISSVVLRELSPLSEEDVFIDLGSGTGKIPVQVALQSKVRLSRGIEYAAARCDLADEALALMRGVDKGRGAALGRGVCGRLLASVDRVSLERGDFTKFDLSDVTVVFVNNRVFEDDLRLAMIRQLARLPNLRRVVSTQKLCFRCGPRCHRSKEACTAFHLSNTSHVGVSWAHACELYTYDRIPVSAWPRPSDTIVLSSSSSSDSSEEGASRSRPRPRYGVSEAENLAIARILQEEEARYLDDEDEVDEAFLLPRKRSPRKSRS